MFSLRPDFHSIEIYNEIKYSITESNRLMTSGVYLLVTMFQNLNLKYQLIKRLLNDKK